MSFCMPLYTCNHPIVYLGTSIAQMDQTKSLAYQAMEELLKAQTTHCKLKRQFVLASTKEELNKSRKEFEKQEVHMFHVRTCFFVCVFMCILCMHVCRVMSKAFYSQTHSHTFATATGCWGVKKIAGKILQENAESWISIYSECMG